MRFVVPMGNVRDVAWLRRLRLLMDSPTLKSIIFDDCLMGDPIIPSGWSPFVLIVTDKHIMLKTLRRIMHI